MPVNKQAPLPEAESGPRLQIKQVARRLIAERGMHNVGVRDIAHAAEQKNLGVVAYYFGTKEKLIAEILIDGAERIENLREAHLSRLEAEGGPKTVQQAVGAIVLPSAEFSDQDAVYGQYFNRFLLQISSVNQSFVDTTLQGRWNNGYQQCLRYLRDLLPDLSRAEQGRRFVFLATYVSSLLSQREIMIADPARAHPTWSSPQTLADIVETASALLLAPAPRK